MDKGICWRYSNHLPCCRNPDELMPWTMVSKGFGDQFCFGMLLQKITCDWHVQNQPFPKHVAFVSVSNLFFFVESSNPAPALESKYMSIIKKVAVSLRESKLDCHVPCFFGVTTIHRFRCKPARTKTVWCDASKVEPWKLRKFPVPRLHWWYDEWHNDERQFLGGLVWSDATLLLFGWCMIFFVDDHYITY